MLDFIDLESLLQLLNNWNMYIYEEESVPYLIGIWAFCIMALIIYHNVISPEEPKKKKKRKKKSTYEGIFFFKRTKQNSDNEDENKTLFDNTLKQAELNFEEENYIRNAKEARDKFKEKDFYKYLTYFIDQKLR